MILDFLSGENKIQLCSGCKEIYHQHLLEKKLCEGQREGVFATAKVTLRGVFHTIVGYPLQIENRCSERHFSMGIYALFLTLVQI